MIYVMSHPARSHSAKLLARRVEGRVIEDPLPGGKPSALRSHIAALRAGVEGELFDDSFIILQDDAIPCPDFRTVAEKVILGRRGTVISLYVGDAHGCRGALRHSIRRCERYVKLPLNLFIPTVGIIWPASYARSFLAWVAATRPVQPWDDEAIMQWRGWLYKRGQKPVILGAIPSIVRHDNTLESIIGHHDHGHRDAYCDWTRWQGKTEYTDGWG